MNYDKIKEDVTKFKLIGIELGLKESLLIFQLLFELCLKEKGINAEIILGYIIIDDTYWAQYCWNKLEIDGEVRQIDVNKPFSDETGASFDYTLLLKPKWKPCIGYKKHKISMKWLPTFYDYYKAKGSRSILEDEKSAMNIQEKIAWRNLTKKARKLKTFDNIGKFLKFE